MADLNDRVDDLEDRLNGVLSVAQNALQRANELEAENKELRKKLDRTEFRVAELELCLPDNKADYDTLDFDQKVGMVRKELMERAHAALNNRSKMDYKTVMWSVFDGNPSVGHCYKLMEYAAHDTPGITYVDPNNGSKHVRINLDEVLDETKAQAGFSCVNKDEQEEAR